MKEGTIHLTLIQLLSERGLDLLNKPLTLDALLRDLHPKTPREVYLIIETIESGVLHKMRLEKPSLDSEFNGFAAQLTAKSGIAPTFARWAVQTWRDALPNSAYVERQASQSSKKSPRWSGSVEDVLGTRRSFKNSR